MSAGERRPDPDRLLEQVLADQQRAGRGKLKIFFGYMAGVGKTYAMLEAARHQAANGVDVVAGYVESHGRPETEALLDGLEYLPQREIEYRGLTLHEFDLDAAIRRHPQLVLVDELAHTNATGLRHLKRWHDVDELLDAGINVYTTLNVQHLDSLNDVVAQITGITVRETVPDTIFDEADSVEVVDIPPGELLQRLREGKVYIPAQAERAMGNFFRGPNLGALREIALRRAADRTHAHVETARVASVGTERVWPVLETILSCIGPSPGSTKVIRDSRRLASSLSARWIAASVETPRTRGLDDEQRHRMTENVRLAERLGAETVSLSGDSAAEEIVSYAKSQNVTKIVIGRTGEPRWRRLLRGDVVDDVMRLSGDIGVYVIHSREPAGVASSRPRRRQTAWRGYLAGLGAIGLATGVAWLFQDFGLAEANKAIVFLLSVLVVAVLYGFGPGVVASVASVLCFDFFFVPPYLTFAVADVQYLITFTVFIVVALLVSTLTARLRRQVGTSRKRERRLEALSSLSRELSAISGAEELALAAAREVSGIFGTEALIYLARDEKQLAPVIAGGAEGRSDSRERAVAQWAFEHHQLAGIGTDTLPDASFLYLPMITTRGTAGVLAIRPRDKDILLSPENRQLLETLATQIGITLDREKLTEESKQTAVEMEMERMRSSLLSSVSHDLRTPLAVIAGASSTLLELGDAAPRETNAELLGEIYDESNRLARLVENLVSMTRLEAGRIAVDKQWFPIEDVIGSALGRLRKELVGRRVNKRLPEDLGLVPLDGVLIEQVLMNLIDNALKYSPSGTTIDLLVRSGEDEVTVEVADRGPGLMEGEEDRIFGKLYRGSASAGTGERGVGLGLAIARAIVKAHGGRIWAMNRPGGGAVFSFTLPLGGRAPAVPEACAEEDEV